MLTEVEIEDAFTARMLIFAWRTYEGQRKPVTVRSIHRSTRRPVEQISEHVNILVRDGLLRMVPTPPGRRGRPTVFYYPTHPVEFTDLHGLGAVRVDRDVRLAPPPGLRNFIGVRISEPVHTPPRPPDHSEPESPSPESEAPSPESESPRSEPETPTPASPYPWRYPEDRQAAFELMRKLASESMAERRVPITHRQLRAALEAYLHPYDAGRVIYDLSRFAPEGQMEGGLYTIAADHPTNPTGEIAYTLRTKAQANAWTLEEAEAFAKLSFERSGELLLKRLEEKHGLPPE